MIKNKHKRRVNMKVAILGMGAYGIALSKIFYKNENGVYV